jgi:hypothetical protein
VLTSGCHRRPAGTGTIPSRKSPDAFVVINTGQAKTVSVQVLGIGTNRFAAFRTVEKQQDGYTAIGEFTLNDGAMEYQASGGSVTTFFGITP